MKEVFEMTWSKFFIFLVMASFVLLISTPIAFAGFCTSYDQDWFTSQDQIESPPFLPTQYYNVWTLDFRGSICGLWVEYDKNARIFVEATFREEGKTYKKVIELTKEMKNAYTQFVRIEYKMRLKFIPGAPTTRKLSDNSWEEKMPKPWIVYPIPDCEIKDLISGKILREESDGYFISDHFIVTKIK